MRSRYERVRLSLKLGSHQLVLARQPLRLLRRAMPEDIVDMEEDLDSLARLLEGDFAWCLAGGMAIPASLGRFYRRHTDIDIEVEGSNLGRLVEKARAEGYGLFSRGAVARLGKTTMVFHFVPLTEAEALTGRWGAIRLARVR